MNMEVYKNLSIGEKFIVDWQFGLLGDFKKALIDTIVLADEYNRMKLYLGFSDEVDAFKKYSYVDGWWESLMERLKDKEELENAKIRKLVNYD